MNRKLGTPYLCRPTSLLREPSAPLSLSSSSSSSSSSARQSRTALIFVTLNPALHTISSMDDLPDRIEAMAIEGEPAQLEEDELEDEDEMEHGDLEPNDYDMRMYGIYRALPVDGQPDWESGEPTTAEEYLRRVRYEADRCPQVVRAEIDTAAFEAKRTHYIPSSALEQLPAAPDWALPSPQWVRQFVVEFQQLRTALQQLEREHAAFYSMQAQSLPHINDLHAWENHCLGPRSATAAAASNHEEQLTSISGQVLDTIMALDQVGVAALLQHQVEGLMQAPHITLARSRWVFALAARIDTPIHADMGAAFRSLFKRCVAWRAAIQQQHDELLPVLNVLIAVAGAFFRQDAELAAMVQQLELASS